MAKTFQVKAHVDSRSEDDYGVPYLVAVFESGNRSLIGHLRVLRFEEDGVNLLRIVWAQLTSEDEDTAVHVTLENGAWWSRALDAVLEHVIFDSGAVDRAVDEDGGHLQYGWVGGEIQEATLLPTANDTKCDIGNPPGAGLGRAPASMEWAKDVFAPDAALTEQQLERFFDDIAQMLAAKAFDSPSDEGEEGEVR